jgi:hypothetical protein
VHVAAAIDSGLARVRPLARRLGLRSKVDGAFDWARLQVDRRTDPNYQPLTERDRSSRGVGTLTRWSAIRAVVDELEPRSAIDIGCNIGWFAAELAELGIPTIGVECHPPYYRTALYRRSRSRLPDLGVLVFEMTPANIELLPTADCTLHLSVWHHLVMIYGVDDATSMLASTWEHTRKVLFFETGETEMPASYGLPDMGAEPAAWLADYLAGVCVGGDVRHLGRHHGGGADDDRAYRRNLFAVVRSDAT